MKVNDLVLVTVKPIENGAYKSEILSPSLVLINSTSDRFGTQSYQFIAAISGDYLLKITTSSQVTSNVYFSYSFNYTIKSSHAISSGNPKQATPNSIIGEINGTDTVYQKIQNIKSNDRVLVSVTPDGHDGYYSEILSPNLTIIGSTGPAIFFSGSHSYQFIADSSGDYLLKFWTPSYSNGYVSSFNYTIKSSHALPSMLPTVTPPPVEEPTSDVTFAVPIVMNSTVGDEVTFSIQSGLNGSAVPYIVDFGDNFTATTFEQSINHKYTTPGSYNVTITIAPNTGERIVQTYLVTVTSKASVTDSIWAAITDPRTLLALVSTSVAVLTFYLNFVRRKKRKPKEEAAN